MTCKLSGGRILALFVDEAEKADEYPGVREGQKQPLSEALAGRFWQEALLVHKAVVTDNTSQATGCSSCD